jgi:hypothetical protein
MQNREIAVYYDVALIHNANILNGVYSWSKRQLIPNSHFCRMLM